MKNKKIGILAEIINLCNEKQLENSDIKYEFNGEYLKFELPNCNSEWTFEVWEFIMYLCKLYPECYPVHLENAPYGIRPNIITKKHDNAEYHYVSVSKYLGRD